jgi:hypothetical protein
MNRQYKKFLSSLLRIITACFPHESKWLSLFYKVDKPFLSKMPSLIHFIWVLVPTYYIVLHRVWLYIMPLLFPFYMHILVHGPYLGKLLIIFHFKLILKGFYYVLLGYVLPSSKDKIDELALGAGIRSTFFGDYGKNHLPLATVLLLVALVFALWLGVDSGLAFSKANLEFNSYLASHPDVDKETRMKIAALIVDKAKSNQSLYKIFSQPTLKGSLNAFVCFVLNVFRTKE